MNVTPIGGKSPSETLLGVAVNASGAVITERAWKTTVTKIVEDVEPTAGTHACTAVDLSTAGAARTSSPTATTPSAGRRSSWISSRATPARRRAQPSRPR